MERQAFARVRHGPDSVDLTGVRHVEQILQACYGESLILQHCLHAVGALVESPGPPRRHHRVKFQRQHGAFSRRGRPAVRLLRRPVIFLDLHQHPAATRHAMSPWPWPQVDKVTAAQPHPPLRRPCLGLPLEVDAGLVGRLGRPPANEAHHVGDAHCRPLLTSLLEHCRALVPQGQHEMRRISGPRGRQRARQGPQGFLGEADAIVHAICVEPHRPRRMVH
mmetsp:Transcript_71757/g.219722  ORF Transcript_71757/g.219722 Transcript_71757/m.219722 type:complete len:221 (+) Transcript_71757:757-1419(+)